MSASSVIPVHLSKQAFDNESAPQMLHAAMADLSTPLSWQVEGAFIMGMGMMAQEQVIVDTTTGRLLTDGTWTYKIPTVACIPQQFNVAFLKVLLLPSSMPSPWPGKAAAAASENTTQARPPPFHSMCQS